MKIHASVVSHPGKCRSKNEDNFCFNGKTLKASATPWPLRASGRTGSVFFGIFDGMGGIKAGERASAIAAEIARTALGCLTSDTAYDVFLLDICKQANAFTCDEMIKVVKQRMGTTASMLLFSEDQYVLCNIGDSPIYLFRENELRPIFHEHTEKENYLRLHGADAVPPKKKFKLTQYIGIFPEEMEIEPYVAIDKIESGDRFLITSDGLTDMVAEDIIAQVLEKRMSPAKTVKTLLQLALDNGGKDNTTIICIDIE